MWEYDKIDPKLLDSYPTLIEKDNASKGDFEKDFSSFCETNSIVKCPYIRSYPIQDKEGIRIANAVVDLPNWRAMLLAAGSLNSKVIEIAVHQCTLTPVHLVDLAKVLVKMGTIKSVKLQFSKIFNESTDINEVSAALKALLQDATSLEYLSLKGLDITDDILASILPSLTENYKLVGLNLSSNGITDQAAASIFPAIKYNPNYKAINLSSNSIQGELTLKSIGDIYLGSLSTPNDDAAIKANTKLVADKNKAIKDNNKKRKKAGYADITEVAALPELVRTVDGKQWLSNRVLEFIDLSENSVTRDNLNSWSTSLSSLPPTLVDAANTRIIIGTLFEPISASDTFTNFAERLLLYTVANS